MPPGALTGKGRLKEKPKTKSAATAIRPLKRKTKKKEEWEREKTADSGFANMAFRSMVISWLSKRIRELLEVHHSYCTEHIATFSDNERSIRKEKEGKENAGNARMEPLQNSIRVKHTKTKAAWQNTHTKYSHRIKEKISFPVNTSSAYKLKSCSATSIRPDWRSQKM